MLETIRFAINKEMLFKPKRMSNKNTKFQTIVFLTIFILYFLNLPLVDFK